MNDSNIMQEIYDELEQWVELQWTPGLFVTIDEHEKTYGTVADRIKEHYGHVNMWYPGRRTFFCTGQIPEIVILEERATIDVSCCSLSHSMLYKYPKPHIFDLIPPPLPFLLTVWYSESFFFYCVGYSDSDAMQFLLLVLSACSRDSIRVPDWLLFVDIYSSCPRFRACQTLVSHFRSISDRASRKHRS